MLEQHLGAFAGVYSAQTKSLHLVVCVIHTSTKNLYQFREAAHILVLIPLRSYTPYILQVRESGDEAKVRI